MSRPAARHGLLAASLLALPLAQCSSTPPPVTAAPPPVTAPRPPQPVEPMYDLSQVPAPPGLLATVRVGSARGLVRRLAERVGVPDLVTMLEEQLPSAFGDDAAMARVVDLDAPVDVIVYRTSRGREAAVLAIGAVSMPRAEDALAGDHHLAPMSNGARRVQRVERGEACNDEDERVAGGCIRPSAQACAPAEANLAR